jgi:hypothetical protein
VSFCLVVTLLNCYAYPSTFKGNKHLRKSFLNLWRRLTVVALVAGLIAGVALLFLKAVPVEAANPSTINFQGKVVNADGTNVADGSYTFIFRLYTSGATNPNTTTCTLESTCYWEETQTSVSVSSGVFQVELGSVCAFSGACNSSHSGINFNSNNALYLTMKFNGDSQGYMTPMMHFTSVPYAFNADNLGGISSSGFIQNGTGAQAANFNVQSAGSGNVTAVIQGASGQSVDIAQIKANAVTSPLFSVGNTGTTTAQNSTDSTTAFLVKDAAGSTALGVDTTPLNSLLTNTSFENTDVSLWVYTGASGGSVSRVTSGTTQPYLGSASLSVTSGTSATASDGVKYVTGNGTNKLTISNTYMISWYDKLASGTLTTVIAAYDRDGSGAGTPTNCTSINSQTVLTTGWTRHTCQITTDSTTPAADAYILIKQGDTTTRTFYIDAVQIESGTATTAYKETGLALNGVVNSPIALKNQSDSTTALQVQNAAGSNLFSIDSLNMQIVIGSGIGPITIIAGSGSAITITANAASTWSTTTGLLTVQGAGGVTLDGSGGSFTQKIANSSTTAYQLQETGGTAILSADTTNNKLQIGSSSTDATAILLILDSYNTTDPAGTNGAMYYSTSTNSFRCYENAAWKDCDPIKVVSGSSAAAGTKETWHTLTANATATGSTTLAACMTTTGLVAGTYTFDYYAIWQSAATTTGANFSINYTGTVTKVIALRLDGTTGTTAATGVTDSTAAVNTGSVAEIDSSIANNGALGPNAGVDTISTNEFSRIYGTLVVSGAGNLELRCATEVAASNITLQSGTSLTLKKVN